MPDTPISLFISYAHADSAFVDRLEADLQQQGFDPWVDRQRLKGGQRWRRELQDAVKRAQVLLIVLSPDAVASENVQIEYDYVLELGNVVIPLYYRQCEVPMELRAIQWIDFRHSYEQGLAALVQVLHQHQYQGTANSTSASKKVSAPATLPAAQEGRRSQAEAAAERPWNVPFSRNPFFTGRAQLLERLHAQLSRSQSAALTQPYALSGLGGIGKTQTAIEYAFRYADEYSAVFWVRADSRETLIADFVDMARLLSLPGQDAQDQKLIVTATKHWLEHHAGWLLILDNADELTLLTDFLPSKSQGHLLITTRAQATGKLAQSLSVEKMEPSEGMQLMLHRAKLLASEESLDNVSAAMRKAAQQLVEELDGLPLALDQAGAYIEETGCSLTEYLDLYGQRRLALLEQQSSMSIDYPHSVASTWALSFAKLEQQSPAAADLLRLCAFLHPDAIPEVIFTEGAAELGSVLSPVAADPLLFNAAIQGLRRYSLVNRLPEAKLLNLHRLVQVVLKDGLDQQTQRQWAERVVRAVDAAFPEVSFATWSRCEGCLPHAQVCASLIDEHHFTFLEAARLLDHAGFYLADRGLYGQAEPMLHQALAISEQVLGQSHPQTATILFHLGDLSKEQGKYAQAEPLFQHALAIREQVLGSEHLDTVTTFESLAWLYQTLGKYEQAEPLHLRALAIQEQKLGPTHPDVAESLNDLAVLYHYQGKYKQAEPLHVRALAIREQKLGPTHPEVAESLYHLAWLYQTLGKFEQAEPLLQRARTISEQAYGRNHPLTAVILDRLGELSQSQGKYEQAEPLFQSALGILEQALGRDRPRAAAILDHLATLYQTQGKYEQAEPLYRRALTITEHALGPEHPRVAETLTGLGQLYTGQGRYRQVEPLLERALTIDEHALGAEHPQTAAVLDAQGYLALLQGREEQAETLLQRALAIREQALGKSHPDVARTLLHLAELYEKHVKLEQAHSLYQRALSIQEQALGPEHPETVATREALTKLLQLSHTQEQRSLTARHKGIPPA